MKINFKKASFIFLCASAIGLSANAQLYTNGNNLIGQRVNSSFQILTGTTSAEGPYIHMQGKNSLSEPGTFGLISTGTITRGATSWKSFAFSRYDGTNWNPQMTITNDGRVGLGNIVNSWDLSGRFQVGVDVSRIGFGTMNSEKTGYGDVIPGGSFIGLNALKQDDNFIGMKSSGTENGGAMIYSNPAGSLNFVSIPSGVNGSGKAAMQYINGSDLSNYVRMSINGNGYVGIGETNPAEPLDIKLTQQNYGIKLKKDNGILRILPPAGLSATAYNPITLANDGGIIYGSAAGNDQISNGFVIAPWKSSASGIRLDQNGNVGIGTNCVGSAKLAVNGTIYGTEVTVAAPNGLCFPDYVFEADYKLKTLNEVEQYIAENKHLPEVPSAVEVEANGINVAKMDAVLLKKIEELTLYMIELKKENESLKKSETLLNSRIEKLEAK